MNKIVKKDGLSFQVKLSAEQKLDIDKPYNALVRSAIDEAILKGASDIHFEPIEMGFQIRLRVCGTLTIFYSTVANDSNNINPDVIKLNILNILKSISNIPLGRQSEPQDERITLPKRGIDIRVSKIPTEFGEKFVFRLFNKNKKQKLSEIGLSTDIYEDVIKAISKKSGLIIITGETGSGKTSTIYSIIEQLDRVSLNIATLENPVERYVSGVNHTSVTPKLSFADGLKALLRQDPDVIVIGEIRDKITANLAVRAASTGHLVISTMHTNSALDIPKVFEHYGADKYQLMSTLILGANQRLIRKLCQSCSATSSTHNAKNKMRTVNKSGCDECAAGYLNERKLIFEYFRKEDIQLNGSIKLKESVENQVLVLAKKGEIDEIEIYRQAS